MHLVSGSRTLPNCSAVKGSCAFSKWSQTRRLPEDEKEKSKIKAENVTCRYVNVLWQHCMQHVVTSCCTIANSPVLQLLVYDSLSYTISECGFLLHLARRVVAARAVNGSRGAARVRKVMASWKYAATTAALVVMFIFTRNLSRIVVALQFREPKHSLHCADDCCAGSRADNINSFLFSSS